MLIHGSPDALHPVTLGGLSAAVSDADIANYISNVLNTVGLTDEQKAAQIADAAEQYGVSVQDISRSTGYSVAEVTDYLSLATPQPQATTPVESVPPPQPPTSIVDNYLYYEPNVISDKDIADYVSNVLNTVGITDQEKATQIANAANQYNVSIQDISRATGYSITEVTDYLNLPQATAAAEAAAKAKAMAAAAAAAVAAATAKNKATQEAAAAAAAAVAKAKATAAAAEAAAKAKAAATGSTLQTEVTTSQTGVSSAMPLILAAAAAYFLGA